MGIMHPAFTTIGKMKGKQKFKSAAAKQEALRLEKEWEDLKKRHATTTKRDTSTKLTYSLSPPPGRSSSRHIPSIGNGVGNGVAKPVLQYTGDNVVGIAVQHKSCLQPIFNHQEAKDSASMRR